MNSKRKFGPILAAMAAIAFVASACGGSSSAAGGSPSPTGSITVAGFNFPESSILAEIYGQALAHHGYNVTYKLNLGNREIVSKAIEAGSIDIYPGYAATDLEFYNKSAGEASGDPNANETKLNTHLSSLNLVALTPSAANDQNAFAMTKANADKYHATKLSDLASIGDQLTLGGPPECATRPFCQPGLKSTYGINFKAFKSLDPDGPLTRAALANNSIQVGLVFSSDADLTQLGLVVLQDDKHLQNADNILPIARTAVASSVVKDILNRVDAKLITTDLIDMNKQVGIDHMDADVVAKAWLQKNGFLG
jgi:osmoprotectant transport system substrate-binding protein